MPRQVPVPAPPPRPALPLNAFPAALAVCAGHVPGASLLGPRVLSA